MDSTGAAMRIATALKRTLQGLAIVVGVGTAAAGTTFGMMLLRGDWQIRHLLPMAEPDYVCFAGTFSKRSLDLEDWGRAKLEPMDKLAPDGKPYMRNVPARENNVGVTAFALRLDYDERKADYDWIYNFRLHASMDKIGELHAVGECPWYERGLFDKEGWTVRAPTSTLYCGIDCDGGMMSVSRIPGTRAVHLVFDRQIGLRMKKGCGGGGSTYRVHANDTGEEFRLEPAPKSACAHMRMGAD